MQYDGVHIARTPRSHHPTEMNVWHLSHITCTSNGRQTMDATQGNASTEIVSFDEY